MADKIEQIQKLKQILEDGLIDQAEFDWLKEDLLQVGANKIEVAMSSQLQSNDNLDQLKKLKQLFEDGLIDQAEFDLLKTDLLQIDKAESVTQLSSEPDKKLDKQKEHSTEEAQKAGEVGVAAAEAKPAGAPTINSPEKKKRSKVIKSIIIALSCFVLVGLLYFGYRLFMNGQVEAAKAEEGSVTEVNGENYGGGYVFAGHSVLLDTPSDEGLELATLSYGSQFQYLSHEKVEVENEIYRQVIADGQEGWIKTNIEGLELTCEDEALNTLSYLVTGEFKDNLLSEIPAYVKWALADYSRSGNFTIDCHQDSIQKVILLRSRLRNRRSSADKREGINDEPKDAIFLNRSSDGKQLLVMLNFSSYTNWTVTELPISNEANFIGLKRVKRRTTLEVIDRFGALEQLKLEFDACKVYSEDNGIFYYYGPDGAMERYAPSTGGVFPTFDAFKSEVVDSLGADFYCDFTNYYYAIASNYVLHESVEGVDVDRYVFFTPERVGLDLDREEISLYFPDGEYSHTVTIYNEPYTRQTEYGLQEYSRTCEIQKENWTVTLSGGGRTRNEDHWNNYEEVEIYDDNLDEPPPPIDVPPPPPAPPIDADVEEDFVFDFPEENPEFKGGLKKMNEYLRNNIQYPEMAKENGIQGRVFVQFVVGKDGVIRDVFVLKGVHKSLDKEAKRVVKSMPRWNPGKQRSKAVSVRYTLPINFQLN